MRQRRRQAFWHDLDVSNTEQLAFVERDIAHQVATFRFNAAFVALAVVRVVELGDWQRHNHFNVARREAGQQQRMVYCQQVQIVILIIDMSGG